MKIFYLFVIILVCNYSYSQEITLKGRLELNENIFENKYKIYLIKQDSIIITSEIDDHKNFNFRNLYEGLYELKIKEDNEELYSQSLIIKENTDLGIINLSTGVKLQQIVVTGNKKLIERKIDRTIFNVENSAATSGGDGLDVLKLTPGIQVKNDQISMVGKSSLKVLVNDKIIPLSDDDLINYLKSISSDNIKKIEVITAPPAKYDAEGNSGLINIVLKTSKKNNWNSYIGGTYKQAKYALFNENLGFTFNYKKLTFNTAIDFYNGKNFSQLINKCSEFTDKNINNYINSNFKLKKYFNGNLDLDYQIIEKLNLGVHLLYKKTEGSLNLYNKQYQYNLINPDILTNSVSKENEERENFYSNFYTHYKLDSLGSKIKFNLNYFKNTRKENAILNSKDYIDFDSYLPTNDFASLDTNNQKISNYSGNLDVEQKLKNLGIDYGIKISHSKITNNIGYSENKEGKNDFQEKYKDLLEYKENIQAIYFSGKRKILDKWEIQIGLRLESFQSKINSIVSKEEYKSNSIELFPSFYLSYVLNEKNTFTFTYTRRINRPWYRALNPFVLHINKNTTQAGNPYLHSSNSDNLELNYTWKNKWTSGIYFYKAEDVINMVNYLKEDDTNFLHYKFENSVNEYSVGLNQNYVFNTFKFWESTLTLNLFYKENKSKIEGFNSNNTLSSSLETNNNLYLNRNKSAYFTIVYQYNFSQYDGTDKLKSFSNFGAGLKCLFLDKKLVLSLYANDIFKTFKYKVYSVYNQNKNKITDYEFSQNLRFSIKYNFGNNSIKSKSIKTGNEEEQIRAK